MNCAEVMELKQRSLDGELKQSEESLLTEHIRRCPACAEMAERLENIHQELVQLPKVAPPYSLVDAILPSLQQIEKQQAAVAGASPSPASGSMERQGSDVTEPRKPEQKPQVVTAVQKWYSKRQWRAAGAVVAAGLVFGLFMVMFKPPTATEQAGDFAELMQSAQESGAPSGSSQSLRSNQPDGKTVPQEGSAGMDNEGSVSYKDQQQDAQPSGGAEQKSGNAQDTAPPKPAADGRAADRQQSKGEKPDKDRKPVASPAEKQEKTGNQDKKAEEPAAGKENTGTEQDEPQDSKVPPSIAAVPGNETPANGSSADAGSMGLEDKELERHSLFAASKEATSPDGKWMVVWENGRLMLYGVTDTEQTKLQTLAFADRPEELIWSSDSSRLEVKVRTADGQRQFQYDVSSNGLTEAAAEEAAKKEPIVVPGTTKPAT
ncbi:anti-sigma factor family protein [Paenibacillus thiaminolyticus]|uniref:anti-sigma factor family protein n=1 Tax=Paenibacillus thiaminolyticus TaxID=49283 RepID=UPI002543CF37|nr:zf-HC2 domain-containing protein [Paenibacillus thiaminolyticus]WII39246.1 zf-HC2 domain-containing protein [Paenibacillus thiaminolyticus]